MPIDADVALAPARLRFTVTDPWPSVSEMTDLRGRLIRDGHLTPTTRALFDIRHAKTPGYTEARSIVAAAAQAGSLPLRRAYLVGSAVQYGFTRQLQALAPHGMSFDIFTNEDAANVWFSSEEGGTTA